MERNNYTQEDLARLCEVAVVLEKYDTGCTDLHDFFSDHVKPLFDAWKYRNGEGVYKCKDEVEQIIISVYLNRVAPELYKKL